MSAKINNAIADILRRYRECIAAGFPPDWSCARSFARVYAFAQSPSNDRALESAVLAIQAIWKFCGLGSPSRKTIERILAAVASTTPTPDATPGS